MIYRAHIWGEKTPQFVFFLLKMQFGAATDIYMAQQ